LGFNLGYWNYNEIISCKNFKTYWIIYLSFIIIYNFFRAGPVGLAFFIEKVVLNLKISYLNIAFSFKFQKLKLIKLHKKNVLKNLYCDINNEKVIY